MNVPVVNASGEEVGTVELSSVFSAKVNRGLMHQALVRQMANGRQGTHKAQTRAEVSRTTAKWYRQKGTGRARHGSRRAPIFVGGGVAHGPRPRKYTKRMPRKMRRGALRSALTVKAQGGDLVILDELAMAAPKTKDLVNVLKSLVGAESTLLLLPARDENVELSARNIPTVKAMQANYLNIRDLLGYQKLVISLASLDVIEDFLGDRGDEFAEFLAMDEEE